MKCGSPNGALWTPFGHQIWVQGFERVVEHRMSRSWKKELMKYSISQNANNTRFYFSDKADKT